MAKKKEAATELAEKLVAVLKAQRELGKEAYPLTRQRLVELADPGAAPEVVEKAVGKKPFKDGAVLTSKANPIALVALAKDMGQLAGDPRLLETVLATLCTPDAPLWPLTKVKAAIENTKLRKPFAEAIARQIREDSLPPAVGYRLEKKTLLLFLQRIPPSPPPEPPKKPEVVLAENLLQVLEAQRRLGGDSYPLPLTRLVQLTGADAKLAKKALGLAVLKDKLLRVDAKNGAAPVALVEDRDWLLGSRALLEYLLRKKRKDKANALPVDSLLPKKSPFRDGFLDAANRQMDAHSLPPTVGWMWIGKKKHIFFLEDVHRATPAPPPAPPMADFGRAFDEAFARIDRHKGGHNFVSLVDLRRALPGAADGFDAALRQLRVAGRYTLSAAEGRHGITPEEREAGVMEDGALLLYVSRKAP